MRSILLFTFLAFFMSSLSCCRFDEREIAPIFPKDGEWHARNIEITNYDPDFQVLDRKLQNFKENENTLVFNEAASEFKEFENGVLTRMGNYIAGNQPGSMIMMSSTDTLEMYVTSILSDKLTLQSQTKTETGQLVKVFNYGR